LRYAWAADLRVGMGDQVSANSADVDRFPVRLLQSLAALDQPLGTRAPREPKQPKAATATATATAPAASKDKAAPKAPERPKEVDPAVAAKLAEEEEKKRKRAERFGAPVSLAGPGLDRLGHSG